MFGLIFRNQIIFTIMMEKNYYLQNITILLGIQYTNAVKKTFSKQITVMINDYK